MLPLDGLDGRQQTGYIDLVDEGRMMKQGEAGGESFR